jgi:hypothetical protein
MDDRFETVPNQRMPPELPLVISPGTDLRVET